GRAVEGEDHAGGVVPRLDRHLADGEDVRLELRLVELEPVARGRTPDEARLAQRHGQVRRDHATILPHGAGTPAREDNVRVTASASAPAFDAATFLPDELLERFRERAARVDRDNVFPDEDLAELKDAGYLAILVPQALGGAGLG